jgi:hypothetical protein
MRFFVDKSPKLEYNSVSASFNGRTGDFESLNQGSIPCAGVWGGESRKDSFYSIY